MGAAYRASGRTLPIMDGLAFHPYADSSGQSPGTPHPKSTTIGLADYDRLIQTLADRVRRNGAERQHLADPVRRVRRRIDDSGREGKALHGRRASDDAPRRRDHPGPVLRAGASARLLPTRTSSGSSCSTHRTRPTFASWQSGVVLRRRNTRRRASMPFATHWPALVAARSRTVTALRCRSRSTRVRFPTSAELRRGSRSVQFRCSLDCAWELRAAGAGGR